MATKAQILAAFGGAAIVSEVAIADTLGSDGSIGGVANANVNDQAVAGNLTVAGTTQLKGSVALGDAVTDPIGFYGTTPAVQPSGAGQAAVTTAAITAVATTGSTTTTPAGYATLAQADAIVAAINLLITRAGALTTLVNQIRADNVTLGIQKGAA